VQAVKCIKLICESVERCSYFTNSTFCCNYDQTECEGFLLKIYCLVKSDAVPSNKHLNNI